MMKKPKKLSVYTASFIEILLYDESSWYLRLSITLIIIFGWAGIGILLEAPTNIQTILWQGFRYMLAPLAAITGAFMLGASYVQDVYEIKKYSLALRYIWAAIYNSPNMSMTTSMLAALVSATYFGLGLGLILVKIYGLYIGLLIGFWAGVIFGLGIGFIFGRSFIPALKISEGVKKTEDEINLVDLIGGPGWLFVEPGNVVVMERLESPSYVLGAGRHFINRFQRIKNIISLKDQQVGPKELTAVTKDGINVTLNDFQFRYRLYTGHKNHVAAKRTLWNPYPYSIQAARNMTYNRSVNKDGILLPWDNAVQNAIDGNITGYINKNPLDRVLSPLYTEKNARSEIEKAMKSPGTRAALKSIGAELLWYDIGRFKVSPDINTERMKALFAKLDGDNAIIRAQGEAEIISTEERGRSEGQVTVLKGIIQALDDADLPDEVDENMWNIVLARTAQIIETMTSNSNTK